MFFHSALRYICAFLSGVGLPLLLLATFGAFIGSAYDLLLIQLSEDSSFVRSLDLPTLIKIGDPLHVLIASGIIGFLLIITSGDGSERTLRE